MEKTIIHVIDDDRAVLDSLLLRLRVEGWDIATYESAVVFLKGTLPTRGCVLSDFRMPAMSGLELQEHLTVRGNPLPIILMTGQGDVPLAVRAMRAGAIDFLEKPFSDEQLLGAIRRALAVDDANYNSRALRREATAKLDALTPREREVLELLVIGKSNKEIARELGTSPRTIDVHRSHVFGKLDADTLPDLVYLHLTATGRS